VVVDLSVGLRGVKAIDVGGRRCTVEAGVVVEQLNRTLAEAGSGLFFAPDPATIAQATIGGCIGNNAAGSRSIRYGRTSENLAGVEVVMGSGERVWLRRGAGREQPAAARVAEEIARIALQNAPLIRERIPRLVRRNAGYGIDLVLDQLDAGVQPIDLNLSGLICGSEGTLAVVLAAELVLQPVPRERGLAIVAFESVDAAIAAVPAILRLGPSAVELLDDVVLDAARGNVQCARYLALLPKTPSPPAAVLYVEFQTERAEESLDEKFAQLSAALPMLPMSVHRDGGAIASAWALRKAGEALLHGISAGKKPITFVEDNSIPIENLARFAKEFRRIVADHGTTAAFYAHASVGVLHVRPLIDLRDPRGLAAMQSIAVRIADLARDCGGVMSGEHGDGKARGPLLERLYGPEMIEVFRQIKRCFDPRNILNPGNIVDAGAVESITQNLRVHRERDVAADAAVETFFDYSDQEDLRGAVEMCNGAGFCRKMAGGTMCPSYRATLDERHSTRGRGNALRLAITGQALCDGPAVERSASRGERGSGNTQLRGTQWNDPETVETLDLCLSCKACKTECPSNVDISRLKAEYTAQRYRITGVPLAARAMGHIRAINQFAASFPAAANFLARSKSLRPLVNRLLHLAPQRSLPEFGPSLFRWFEKRPRHAGADKVVLFGDCFTAFNEPHIGRSAVYVLEQLGYEVVLPRVGCCGRAMISLGLLDDARHAIDRLVAQLNAVLDDPAIIAIVACEPSCLSAIKDDWLQLKLSSSLDVRRRIAERSMLVEDFVERRWDAHPRRPSALKRNDEHLVLHGHCHQKALWGDQTSSAILRRLCAGQVDVLPSGCCGMAGGFGYGADKYELSMKIGELSVFPPIRAMAERSVIVAPGTSCRHQIRDGTGRRAVHPIEAVAGWFGEPVKSG
jgi:FAD/FMN-containing dehydrogenase/Fe-S oxidoreductase